MKSILIFKIGAIGDVVMTLPVLAAIKEKYPTARVSWLCGNTIVPLLREFKEIDELVIVDEKKLLAGPVWARVAAMASVWVKLMGHRFDLVLNGHSDWRYRLLLLSSWARELRSISRRGSRRWLIPGRSHSDEYVRLVTMVDDFHAPKAVLPDVDFGISENLRALMPKSAWGGVAIAPGGARNALRDDIQNDREFPCHSSHAEF